MLVPSTFECRPTRAALPAALLPDELMIDWQGMPKGATASIYIPAASAGDIVAKATRLYGSQRLTRTDAHTVVCDANAITYIPIPAGMRRAFEGLLTIDIPADATLRGSGSVIIRQITTPDIAVRRDAARQSGQLRRQVIGAFRLNIPFATDLALLKHEERLLAFFRWTLLKLTQTDRWRPVMVRYVDALAVRVKGFGGDPSTIYPSQVGAVGPKAGSGAGGNLGPGSGQNEHTGKIVELVYDRFGDFEGFILRTRKGDTRDYRSRERHVCELARWAWQARLLVTIIASNSEPAVPVRILLHAPEG